MYEPTDHKALPATTSHLLAKGTKVRSTRALGRKVFTGVNNPPHGQGIVVSHEQPTAWSDHKQITATQRDLL